jgi:hypothetical protein
MASDFWQRTRMSSWILPQNQPGKTIGKNMDSRRRRKKRGGGRKGKKRRGRIRRGGKKR